MKIIAEMWGEHVSLSLGELRGILDGEKQQYRILQKDYPIVILEVEDINPLKRAGLLRRFSKHLYSGKDIPKLGIELKNYAIRIRKQGSWSEREIIKKLAKGINGSVTLENPENVVRVYAGEELHIGLEIYDFSLEGFEERRSKNLPVSYPITMHPRLVRFMINLARVKEGAKILDPFCGTGSILLEAGLMGMDIYGSDIDEKMINASRINLEKFGIKAKLEVKDVGEISENYDAVVTDPPYGRSSSSKGEKIYELYERAFEKFSEIAPKVVIALPDERAIKIGEEYFNLVEVYPYRVHKSLTRYFSYFRV
jgi:tRNA (guanine10-N2)-dimethyltransferase